MNEIKVGDIVARKSYGQDVCFKVEEITGVGNNRMIVLKGVACRLYADAPESDLEIVPQELVREHINDAFFAGAGKNEKKCLT